MSNSEISVFPHGHVEIVREIYPWINAPISDVSTVLVDTEDVTFLYGSIIGLNKSIVKIADSVSSKDSSSLQNILFSGLPSVMAGKTHSGIGKVEGSGVRNSNVLFTASRNLVREPSLIFAIDNDHKLTDLPVVLRVGVSNSKDISRLIGVMGIKQVGGRRRKS